VQVPRVSAFRGIVIWMYFDENIHPGRPHFHAKYAGVKANYDIRTLQAIVGQLHPRANRLVVEWGRVHQFELRRDWKLVRARQTPVPIDPPR
jgi:hypothetical protein